MIALSEKIQFTNPQGHTLDASLEKPVGVPRAYALFAHCFTCSKDSAAATRIARELAGHGVAVLRFDFTGLGGSEGDFANTSFQSNVSDLETAANYLERNYEAPQLLIGHSLGGAAVLAVASRLDSVKAVVAIGAPSDPSHIEKYLEETNDGRVKFTGGPKPFVLHPSFLEDLRSQNLKQDLKDYTKATLILHSPVDRIVDIDHARSLFDLLPHPKSFISLDQTDHLILKKENAKYAAQMIASWVEGYLPPTKEALALANEVVVDSIGESLTQSIQVGSHKLLADEPIDSGGKNLGPSPYDYLLAALGACTSMTLRMYSRHKKWPLEGVRVRLSHQKIHAKDCENCETHEGKIDTIHKEITLRGPLSEDQKQRLLEIADRCPVHKTLHAENKITSELIQS